MTPRLQSAIGNYQSAIVNRHLIGLDLGTSAIKGVLMGSARNEIAHAERRTVLLHPKEDRVEFDPEQHYQDVCAVIRELAAVAPGPVAAIAMAAASGNTLLADGDGSPLTPVISWMDQRVEKDLPDVLKSLSSETVHRIAGWPCVEIFPLAHLAWMKENQAEIYSSAAQVCMNSDWLLFRLTGKRAMDVSTATTFHLMNQVAGTYHKPFLNVLDLQEDQLAPLVPSGTAVGALTAQAQADTGLDGETQVLTGCFDHPSAARATGVVEPGQLMLSCGTSWVGFFPEMNRNKIIDAGLLCDPFLSNQGGPWGAIFSVPQIGRAVDWYIDNLIAPDEADRLSVFDQTAAEAEPGAGGLNIDLRETPGPIDAEVKNISRAVMEGAARLLHEKIEELAAFGITFSEAVMVGGPSRSPVWPGIVEEITGLKLTVGFPHAGAAGAAILAGTGIGILKNNEKVAL